MKIFKDKVILITGAGKGRGRILAQAFAEQGAFVAANDISPVNLDSLVANGDGRIKAYVEDVAKKVGVQNLVNQVEDDFGRIDILINHAAVEPRVALLDMDEWDWHRVLDVNLTMVNQVEVKNEAAFASSMKGFEELSRHAADELAPFGIHVYAVADAGDTIVDSVLTLLERAEDK